MLLTHVLCGESGHISFSTLGITLPATLLCMTLIVKTGVLQDYNYIIPGVDTIHLDLFGIIC